MSDDLSADKQIQEEPLNVEDSGLTAKILMELPITQAKQLDALMQFENTEDLALIIGKALALYRLYKTAQLQGYKLGVAHPNTQLLITVSDNDL